MNEPKINPRSVKCVIQKKSKNCNLLFGVVAAEAANWQQRWLVLPQEFYYANGKWWIVGVFGVTEALVAAYAVGIESKLEFYHQQLKSTKKQKVKLNKQIYSNYAKKWLICKV